MNFWKDVKKLKPMWSVHMEQKVLKFPIKNFVNENMFQCNLTPLQFTCTRNSSVWTRCAKSVQPVYLIRES